MLLAKNTKFSNRFLKVSRNGDQHCVRAYLGPHCILAQKKYCQKLMVQLNSTAFFFLPQYVYFEQGGGSINEVVRPCTAVLFNKLPKGSFLR